MKRRVSEQHQVDFEASLLPKRLLWFPEVVAGFRCPFAFFKTSHDPCVSATPENLKKCPGTTQFCSYYWQAETIILSPNAPLWGRKGTR